MAFVIALTVVRRTRTHTANSHTVIHNTLTNTLTQCKLDHLVLAACIQLHFVLLQLLSRFAAQLGRQMAREEGV